MDENNHDFSSPVSLGKLSVPVEMAYLRHALAYTAETAKMLSFDEIGVSLLELAVEEAFTNAVKHFSKTPGVDENIHVEFSLNGADFIISIRDRGIPFDIDEVESYEAADAIDADKPGLGMTLMKKSVDKVEVISGGNSGKEVRLSKRLPKHAVLPEGVVMAGIADPVKNRRALNLDNVTVRFPTDEDMPSVRRLAWRCHGYDYASLFYDLNKLRDMLASRLYLPVIAVDPDNGEAVYHVALMLESQDEAVPVEGMEFADPDVTCEDLPRKTTMILHEIARRRGFRGVRINTSTSNLAAQKNAVDSLGASPCAVLMSSAADASARSGTQAASRAKIPAIVHYSAMDTATATVYLPARHSDMASDIYKWLELPRNIKHGHESPIPKSSEVECRTNPDSRHSVIRARTMGMDSVEKIHSHMNSVRSEGSEVISVWLATDSPSTPEVALWCEKVGMSFAGIIPAYFNGCDALVMQWVGVPLDMGAVRIYGDKSRELFSYVKNCLGY